MQSFIETSTPRTILQRIGRDGDRAAIEECIDTYGSLIWTLAKKHTASNEEAETAALKIFETIWKASERFDTNVCEEKQFIGLIVKKILKI